MAKKASWIDDQRSYFRSHVEIVDLSTLMPKMKLLLRLCFMSGEAAFANAEPMESNPWRMLTDEGAAWSGGWISAHRKANLTPLVH